MTWVVLSILFAVVGLTSLLIARANRKTETRPGNEEWEVGGYVLSGLMLVGFVALTFASSINLVGQRQVGMSSASTRRSARHGRRSCSTRGCCRTSRRSPLN